jgi:DNA modification methylase
MTVFYADDSITLHLGDALAVLREMPDESVNCVVTSPPYYGLRDYGEPGQYGLEATPAAYVETMTAVFREARRVLAADGTLWLNIGDSYSAEPPGRSDNAMRSSTLSQPNGAAKTMRDSVQSAGVDRTRFLPRKNLMGMPWRVAFGLQDDGWILRNEIIWSKPNAMPESVKDRLSTRHETVFLFAKSSRYYFDLNPIREPVVTNGNARPIGGRNLTPRHVAATDNIGWKDHLVDAHSAGRNPGDVWTLPTQPFPAAHFAVFPPALAERCLLAGCRPGGTVLDPFAGSCTTGMVATKHGRRFVGIDLSRTYLDLALKTRLAQAALMDEVPA